MEKLGERHDGAEYFEITRPKRFSPIESFKPNMVTASTNFAMDMTFGGQGAHKATRTGGSHRRGLGEIFADTFQGKLAEFGIAQLLETMIDAHHLKPGLGTSPLGFWEGPDLVGAGYALEIKSAKSFSNLLLLEQGNWTGDGKYRHGLAGSPVDITHIILVRVSPHIAEHVPRLFSNTSPNDVARANIVKEIEAQTWKFDSPGFLGPEELKEIFSTPLILKEGDRLGSRGTRMDASNYYAQAGDLRPIYELFDNDQSLRLVASNSPRDSRLIVEPGNPRIDRDLAGQPDMRDFEYQQHEPLGDESGLDGTTRDRPTVKFVCIDCGGPSIPICECGHTMDCSDACSESASGVHTEATNARRLSATPIPQDPIGAKKSEMRGATWTKSDDKTLISLLTAGERYEAIAAKLGRTRGGISARVRNLYIHFPGLSTQGIPDHEKKLSFGKTASVSRLYLDGKSIANIASETSLSEPGVVKALFSSQSLPPIDLDKVKYYVQSENAPLNRGARWTADELADLEKQYRGGMALEEMASTRERSVYAIFSQLYKAGWISDEHLESLLRLSRGGEANPAGSAGVGHS